MLVSRLPARPDGGEGAGRARERGSRSRLRCSRSALAWSECDSRRRRSRPGGSPAQRLKRRRGMLGERFRLACVTCGADGAVAVLDGRLETMPGRSPSTTRARWAPGDAFAAGLLVALALRGRTARCARGRLQPRPRRLRRACRHERRHEGRKLGRAGATPVRGRGASARRRTVHRRPRSACRTSGTRRFSDPSSRTRASRRSTRAPRWSCPASSAS